MAEMTIQLRINPETGKKDIIVSLRSEADALPHEHERQHRELVDRLIEGGVLSAGEVGKIVVERQEEQASPTPAQSADEAAERRAASQGE